MWDTGDFFAATREGRIVLGLGEGGLLGVLAWEVFVDGAIECAAEGFTDAL
jgi:hypothetical protein